jgi:L-amino acid N-acyltransferase YncA
MSVPTELRPRNHEPTSARTDPPSDVYSRGRCANGVCTAVSSDAQAITWTQALSWQVAYEQRFVPTRRAERNFQADQRRWAQRITHGALPVLVVLRERTVVGYMALREVPGAKGARVAHVESAHLLPTHWRDRTGETLLLAATSVLLQREFCELSIAVLTENTKVQWYLVDHGFEMRDQHMQKGRMYTRYALPLERSL